MLLLRSLVICHWFVILPPWLSLIKTRDKCFSKQELQKAPLLSSSKRNRHSAKNCTSWLRNTGKYGTIWGSNITGKARKIFLVDYAVTCVGRSAALKSCELSFDNICLSKMSSIPKNFYPKKLFIHQFFSKRLGPMVFNLSNFFNLCWQVTSGESYPEISYHRFTHLRNCHNPSHATL